VRVPFADVGTLKIPGELSDEQVLFLSDIFPTGYMAAENCSITPSDTIAVWGCGPVGQFAVKSAFLLAKRVIAIDRYPERAVAHGSRTKRRGDRRLQRSRQHRPGFERYDERARP
jgi:threonine dehydrogenase-like Zn-dependent dehydrogenase